MGFAIRSDALVLASIALRERHDGYTVVDVPSRPDFWYGHALVLDLPPAAPELAAWVERHALHFPAAYVRKRTIVWETEGDAVRAPRVEAPPHGVLERSIVFVRTERYGAPPDERIRPLRDDADWDAAAALNAAEEEDSSLAMQSFARWRFGVVRADAARGRMRMWGLWHEGALAAFAGVYASDALARFATPVTREPDRGRGFFRRLCETAVDATLDERPDATIVICATAGEAPEAIYRRLGFTAAGEVYGFLAEPGAVY